MGISAHSNRSLKYKSCPAHSDEIMKCNKNRYKHLSSGILENEVLVRNGFEIFYIFYFNGSLNIS